MSNFYERLITICTNKDITIKDATYRLGLKSRTHLYRMFKGNPKWSSFQTVRDVLKLTRVDMIFWLFGDE